jgi:hypothetical protein
MNPHNKKISACTEAGSKQSAIAYAKCFIFTEQVSGKDLINKSINIYCKQ